MYAGSTVTKAGKFAIAAMNANWKRNHEYLKGSPLGPMQRSKIGQYISRHCEKLSIHQYPRALLRTPKKKHVQPFDPTNFRRKGFVGCGMLGVS